MIDTKGSNEALDSLNVTFGIQDAAIHRVWPWWYGGYRDIAACT